MNWKLSNGVEMPAVGLGTFKSKEEEAYEAVRCAVEAGYKHIDTAAVYGNEEEVGRALRDSGAVREEIFITTKLWNEDQGYEKTKAAFEKSLKRLGVDYVDLYLIHWPQGEEFARETWRAMEEIYRSGKARAIGVSNFQIHHLEDLMKSCEIPPMVNQVEMHPRLQQKALKEYCDKRGIKMISYGPFGKGMVFEIEELREIAERYNKSTANIVIRWGIQRGIFMIPKSVTPSRIEDNFKVFDFSLTAKEMEIISALNLGKRVYTDPDNVPVKASR